METFPDDGTHVIVRLDPGDDVLESLTTACTDHDIDTGAVVTGIGTLDTLAIHYVHRTDLPADPAERNTSVTLDGSWEVSTVNGVIADGEPHLHVTAYNGEQTVAGHLEPGCTVNVLAEFTLRDLPGLSLTRRPGQKNISKLTDR